MIETVLILGANPADKNVARAHRELPRSLERSPGILVSTCLDVTADAVRATYQFNAGWSCFGSGSVVVPSSTK